MNEHETKFADHRSEIAAKIEAGYASAQQGNLMDEDQVRSALEEKKRAWLASLLKA